MNEPYVYVLKHLHMRVGKYVQIQFLNKILIFVDTRQAIVLKCSHVVVLLNLLFLFQAVKGSR